MVDALVHLAAALSTILTPTVALTFDDGPSGASGEILDTLTDHGAVGTFFVVGDQIPGREGLVAELVEAGMSVQWHSATHPNLTTLTRDQITHQLTLPESLLEAGASPSCLRPPYGSVDDQVRALADEAGLEVVLWDVDPRDWEAKEPAKVVDAVISDLSPGSVVLLHDRPLTARALPDLLREIEVLGYRTVLLCD